MLKNNANFNLAQRAARRIGRELLRDFGEVQLIQSSVAGGGDFAARARRKAETSLVEELLDTRPNYGFWCGLVENRDGTDPTRNWIVDALNGADNFANGIPHWAVCIALHHKGKVAFALVYDPIANELFGAEVGGGAWLNSTRTRVSQRTRSSEMMVATTCSADTLRDGNNRIFEHVIRRHGHVRVSGSHALDLAHLASGRIDAFWSASIGCKEFAPGALLVTESGGMVETFEDETERTGAVAGGSAAFKSVVEIVHESRQGR